MHNRLSMKNQHLIEIVPDIPDTTHIKIPHPLCFHFIECTITRTKISSSCRSVVRGLPGGCPMAVRPLPPIAHARQRLDEPLSEGLPEGCPRAVRTMSRWAALSTCSRMVPPRVKYPVLSS